MVIAIGGGGVVLSGSRSSRSSLSSRSNRSSRAPRPASYAPPTAAAGVSSSRSSSRRSSRNCRCRRQRSSAGGPRQQHLPPASAGCPQQQQPCRHAGRTISCSRLRGRFSATHTQLSSPSHPCGAARCPNGRRRLRSSFERHPRCGPTRRLHPRRLSAALSTQARPPFSAATETPDARLVVIAVAVRSVAACPGGAPRTFARDELCDHEDGGRRQASMRVRTSVLEDHSSAAGSVGGE